MLPLHEGWSRRFRSWKCYCFRPKPDRIGLPQALAQPPPPIAQEPKPITEISGPFLPSLRYLMRVTPPASTTIYLYFKIFRSFHKNLLDVFNNFSILLGFLFHFVPFLVLRESFPLSCPFFHAFVFHRII